MASSIQQIVFTAVNQAELLDMPADVLGDHSVRVKTAFSTVSCGTERANITGDPNVGINTAYDPPVQFPRTSGYSSTGIVVECGKDVTSIVPGDRVVVYWGKHKDYNTVNEKNVVKITDDRISLEEAALSFIATFPLAAIRKTRLEIGEAALVMGQGILGQLAVKLLRAAGATPIIAADLVPERREQALSIGADYALDPAQEGFADRVKALSGGGVPVCIEVTGVGKGFDQALDCMARFGRIALLGCTRDKNFTIDYYRKIHGPGITVIGAHTVARPEQESHPGWFTHRDDISAVLRLCASGRMNLRDMIAKTYSPAECTAVYDRLVSDRNFPTVVQFDWSRLSSTPEA